MARDPICGMAVDEASGLWAERDDQTFYFCSEHCRRTFLAQGTPAQETSAGRPHHRAAEVKAFAKGKYYCPMCPGVASDKQANCPKCGMPLERNLNRTAPAKTIYTCPMHPEVRQDTLGTCSKCGMDLEPQHVEASQEEDDPELRAMTRRFWVSVALGLPVLLLAMLPMWGVPLDQWIGHRPSLWIQFVLSTPVVLWAGWPFFQRGWRSLVTWNLNMFTLISLGTGAAYFYSLVALLPPKAGHV